MKSLGRVIGLFLISQSFLFASLTVMLERNTITQGDSAVLVMEAEGMDVVFPKIHTIDGVRISDKSTTRSLLQVNGKFKKTLIRRYTFNPSKDVTIPAYEVKIDGKIEKSKPLTLKVKEDIKDGKPAFVFEQVVDKEEVYVGEGIVLSYIFKQREDIDLSDANFHAPAFSDFWAKRTAQVPNTQEDGYNIYRINYVLYPQKVGELTLESGRMDVGLRATRRRDLFNFSQVKWKSVYSNPLSVKVKPLPAGVDMYGDYTFSVVADKNKTKANEPINLTITIHGEGNVDDIEDFTLEVPHATVYADKAKRNSTLKDGKNSMVFKQQFAVVSDRNFTIPSLSFSFYNGEKHVEHSREFPIEVINSRALKTPSHLEKKHALLKEVVTEKVVYETSKPLIMITALLSFLSGLLAMWLYTKRSPKERTQAQSPIATRIKGAKNDKALLRLLLPYVDKTPQLSKVIAQLEDNVYHDKKHVIDQKALAKRFDSYLVVEKDDDILKD